MTSSPSRRGPGRTSPKQRAPLGEITASAANEISSRVARAEPWSPPSKADGEANVFALSPFPSKPAQVLLPSTVRKQRSLQNLSSAAQTSVEPARRPKVRLKRSVKTLRDLYEAQAQTEESARPDTAISSRPGTAGSRLRSQSSSDGLSGKFAWEHFKSLAAADELSLLPSLREAAPRLRHTGAPWSPDGVRTKLVSSSPNYRLYSPGSSPRVPVFRDLGEFSSPGDSEIQTHPSSTLDEFEDIGSSPFIVKIGASSSVAHLPALSELDAYSDDQRSDQRRVISPQDTLRLVDPSPSPPPARMTRMMRMTSSSSTSSRKRKRADEEQDPSSPTHDHSPRKLRSSPRQGECTSDMAEPIPSSPPLVKSAHIPVLVAPSDPLTMRSSPPDEGDSTSTLPDDSSPVVKVLSQATSSSPVKVVSQATSSPVVKVLSQGTSSPERQSISEAHASLQDALFTDPSSSSSPGPPGQAPVVRAPLLAQMAGLMVPKRRSRNTNSEDALEPRWPVRLSGDTSLQLTSADDSLQAASTASLPSMVLDEEGETDMDCGQDIELVHDPTNNSQVRIISDYERHEGEDEVTALPGDSHYRGMSLGMFRTNSYLSGSASSHSRTNSLQSHEGSRRKHRNSVGYTQHRPNSSSSVISVVVPTWARRYYSGCYPDSFRYLATSTSNVSLATTYQQQQQQQQQQHGPAPEPAQAPPRPAASTPSRSSRRSIQSVGRSVSTQLSIVASNRPRLTARKSHIVPGVGPLVSNPVQAEAIADLEEPRQKFEKVFDPRSTIRPVSLPPPIDPRAHWKDAAEEYNGRLHDRGASLSALPIRPTSSDWLSGGRGRRQLILQQRISQLRNASPHLHHDHRLNTGSTASRGFGFPFNAKSKRWSPPPHVSGFRGEEMPGQVLCRAQTVCYLTGFIFPISWFIGAALPLPPRPNGLADLEKGGTAQRFSDLSDWEAFRHQTQVKGKQEVMWQNAKWWRTLNRYMCVIGALVIILIIVLAAVGTTQKW